MKRSEVKRLRVGNVLRFLRGAEEDERCLVVQVDEGKGTVRLLKGWNFRCTDQAESLKITLEDVSMEKLNGWDCRLSNDEGQMRRTFFENLMCHVADIGYSIEQTRYSIDESEETLEGVLKTLERRCERTLERVFKMLEEKRKHTSERVHKMLEEKRKHTSERVLELKNRKALLDEELKLFECKCRKCIAEGRIRILKDKKEEEDE